MKRQSLVLSAIVLMMILFVTATQLYQNQREAETTSLASEEQDLFVPADAPTFGDAAAAVTIVEFFDPACESCRAFYPALKQIMDSHPGQVRLVLRYVPLHQGSDIAVKILEAARRQNRYVETLELMYERQPQWASHHHPRPDLIWSFLPQAGVDVEKARADYADPALDAILERDIAAAETLGVRKTPSFFVNGRPLTTFGYEPLVALVQEELAAANAN